MTMRVRRPGPDAARLLVAAPRLALDRGTVEVEPEHLVLAMLREEPDSPAARALDSLGVDLRRLADRLDSELLSGGSASRRSLVMSASSKSAIALGWQEAGESPLSSAHILLGCLSLGGLVERVLTEHGVTVATLRAVIQGDQPGNLDP